MNLYLPIEIYNREAQSKLLVAMESASRGLQVYMGRVNDYILRDFFAPGIILRKSITPSDRILKELKFLKDRNFILTSLDEESGLVEKSSKKYEKERYSNNSLKLVDKVFTWGKFDYDRISNTFKKYKKKLVKSGNPRIDFWRKDFEFFFEKKKSKYKNCILFSLNFKSRSPRELKKEKDYFIEAGYVDRGYTLDIIDKNNIDSIRMAKKLFKLITILAKKTDLTIVVRPHPVDELKNYKFLKKYKNVKVIKDGSISEWIGNAKIVIHSSCAGGLEASVRGRPTISYMPFKSSHGGGHPFSNKYSIKIKNLNDCLNIIKKITNNNIKIKKHNLKDFKLRAWNFPPKKPAYKMIADEFEKLAKLNKIKNNNLFLKYRFKIRDIRSKVLKLKYGNIKFSFFDRNETLKEFGILKELDPKFKDLKLDFIKKDIIQITNNV